MKEINRIEGFNNGEMPETTKMIITVNNVSNPHQVLKNTKEVMKAISQFAFTGNWPPDEGWKSLLPEWFVKSMTTKTSKDRDRDKNLWHFESWVESMYHRAWVWYSSKIKENSVIIVLELLNIPFVFEQFLYIFYAQGIPMSNITSEDDIYGKTQH